jgi:hypothetical protein
MSDLQPEIRFDFVSFNHECTEIQFPMLADLEVKFAELAVNLQGVTRQESGLFENYGM